MTQTVGDFVVSRLHVWGVRRMFGYPGDGINGVFGALNRADDKIEFIQARHEEMAAFMVCLCEIFRRARRLHRDLWPRGGTSCDRHV